MNIDFVVKKPVSVKHPKNKYRLTVKVMHGDADQFENKHQDFAGIEDLRNYVALFAAFFKLSWNAACDKKTVMQAVRKASVGHWNSPDEAWEAYYDFVGPDVTCDDYLASPHKMFITYFDKDGIEYKVDMDFDGAVVSEINRK
jgi:hypothetical protein